MAHPILANFWHSIRGASPWAVVLFLLLPTVLALAGAFSMLNKAVFGDFHFVQYVTFFLGGDLPAPTQYALPELWTSAAVAVRFLIPPLLASIFVAQVLQPSRVFAFASCAFLEPTADGFGIALRCYNSTALRSVDVEFRALLRIRNLTGTTQGYPSIRNRRLKLLTSGRTVSNESAWSASSVRTLLFPRSPFSIFIPLRQGDVTLAHDGALNSIQGVPVKNEGPVFLSIIIKGSFPNIGSSFVEHHDIEISRPGALRLGAPAQLIYATPRKKLRSSEDISRWYGWKWFEKTEAEQWNDPSYMRHAKRLERYFPGIEARIAANIAERRSLVAPLLEAQFTRASKNPS